ncbi:hypothetical protein [Saccharothrix lopnurensis]|uniref:Uncharacterized protein n=1 Tax=Saccharothrix lopnurensis TaxID=1670621 RepID=A0ABW1P724_9PSEU
MTSRAVTRSPPGPFGLGERSTTGEVLPELLPGNAVTLTLTVTGAWPPGPLDVRVRAEPVASAAQSLSTAIALWRARRKIRVSREQPSRTGGKTLAEP